jgi:hypothetical protein
LVLVVLVLVVVVVVVLGLGSWVLGLGSCVLGLVSWSWGSVLVLVLVFGLGLGLGLGLGPGLGLYFCHNLSLPLPFSCLLFTVLYVSRCFVVSLCLVSWLISRLLFIFVFPSFFFCPQVLVPVVFVRSFVCCGVALHPSADWGKGIFPTSSTMSYRGQTKDRLRHGYPPPPPPPFIILPLYSHLLPQAEDPDACITPTLLATHYP